MNGGSSFQRYHWTYQCNQCSIKSGYGFIGTTPEAYDNAPKCCRSEPMRPIRGNKEKEA